MKLLDLKDQIPVIRQYARDKNQVIRIAAIVALSEWGDEENRPAFEEAAKAESHRLKRAGEAAPKRLDEFKKKRRPGRQRTN